MPEYCWLIGYCMLVLIGSLLGGYVPFVGRVSHDRLQFYLSLSAGVMLGASFFHVMPEAMKMSENYFGWWMSLGVVGLFCIERFIAPHSHEVDGGNHQHHHEPNHGDGHAHDEHHHHLEAAREAGPEQRAAAPAVAGWLAVLGLTIHTFMNGVGLAGAVSLEAETRGTTGGLINGWALPGLAMFLAIVLHKPADALAISTVLTRKGVSRGTIGLVQLGFGTVVSLGVVAFHVARQATTEAMQHQVTGAALAFSAGTFLFIALSDLLPEVQFHKHDRFQLFLALVCGVALMGGIALLEGHDDEGHNHDAHEKHLDHPDESGHPD